MFKFFGWPENVEGAIFGVLLGIFIVLTIASGFSILVLGMSILIGLFYFGPGRESPGYYFGGVWIVVVPYILFYYPNLVWS